MYCIWAAAGCGSPFLNPKDQKTADTGPYLLISNCGPVDL